MASCLAHPLFSHRGDACTRCCFHRCAACRWLSHHKRICPLCKQRVSSGAPPLACWCGRACTLCTLLPRPSPSWRTLSNINTTQEDLPAAPAVIYDITPAGTYREREVPPSPKLATAGSGQADGDGGLPLLQRLQDFLGVAGLLDPYEQQQLGQERGRGSGGGGGGGAARRLRTEAGSGRPGSRRGTQPSSTAAAAAGGGPAGPRPYFWRLQQRLQAGAYRPGGAAAGAGDGAAGEGPVSEQDYVLLWRRQIYDQVGAAVA